MRSPRRRLAASAARVRAPMISRSYSPKLSINRRISRPAGSFGVGIGALACGGHDASTAFCDEPFDHGDCDHVTPNPITFRHEQYVSPLQSANRFEQYRPILNRQRTGCARVREHCGHR